jgi:hypothetical protein
MFFIERREIMSSENRDELEDIGCPKRDCAGTLAGGQCNECGLEVSSKEEYERIQRETSSATMLW